MSDRPAHTHQYADQSHMVSAVVGCDGCQWEIARIVEMPPDERPKWARNLIAATEHLVLGGIEDGTPDE